MLEQASLNDADSQFRCSEPDFLHILPRIGPPYLDSEPFAIYLWLRPTNIQNPSITTLFEKTKFPSTLRLFLYWLKHHTRHIVLLQMTTALRLSFLWTRQDGSSRAICMVDEFTLCKRRSVQFPPEYTQMQAGRTLQNQHCYPNPNPRSYYEP